VQHRRHVDLSIFFVNQVGKMLFHNERPVGFNFNSSSSNNRSSSFKRSRLAVRCNQVAAKTPESAPTIPAMVGMVALETPEAIERAFPVPEMAITSNTSIMPVTVPIKPSSGHNATNA